MQCVGFTVVREADEPHILLLLQPVEHGGKLNRAQPTCWFAWKLVLHGLEVNVSQAVAAPPHNQSLVIYLLGACLVDPPPRLVCFCRRFFCP